MAAMAVLSTRSGHISTFGLRMADFLSPCKQFLNGQVEPFLEKAGEASVRFIRPASRSGRFIKAEDQASGRDGRFINQERPHLYIRSADGQFHIVPYKDISEPFLSRAVAVLSEPMAVLFMAVLSTKRFIKVKDQASGRNGRFINQNWAIGQLGRFHIVPRKQFIGQVEPF